MKYRRLLIGLLCLGLSGTVTAQGSCGALDRVLCALEEPGTLPPSANPKSLKYGKKYWQKISFYRARTSSPAPLVVVLRAGGLDGWSGWLRYRLNQAGYSAAFVAYGESVPKADGAIAAYTSAIAYLARNASELGFDSTRLALYGTGNEAGLAALMAMNPALLEAAGVPFASIRAVVGVDGTGLDIPGRIAATPNRAAPARRYYGRNPADLVRHSPVSHLDAPNAPGVLLLAYQDNPHETAEAKGAVAKFVEAGIDGRFVALPPFREGWRRTYFMLETNSYGSEEILEFLRAHLSGSAGS